jgi:hypothetical protein
MCGKAGAREQEWALDEEVEHLLVKRPVIFLDRLLRLRGSRIKDEDVNRAKAAR